MKRASTTLVIALLLIACGTSQRVIEYRTIASIKLTVDTAMNVWADRVIDGKTTPAQELQVRAAFKQYTIAAAAAAAVMRAVSDPAPPNLTGAADALLNLLAAFQPAGGH